MKYKITSLAFKVFLWCFFLLFSVGETMIYLVVLFPGRLEFSFLEYILFFCTYLAKVLGVVTLTVGNGPLKILVIAAVLPQFIYSIYCALIYPLSSGQGYGTSAMINVGMAIACFLVAFGAHKFIFHQKN